MATDSEGLDDSFNKGSDVNSELKSNVLNVAAGESCLLNSIVSWYGRVIP